VGLIFPANILAEKEPYENVYEKREGTAKAVCSRRKGGKTVNREAKYIKKLMGWCPNAKTFETGSRISSVNFELYDQSGGEKARSPIALSRFSRLDARLLLPTLFLTPIYIIMLFLKGINSEFFFLGILFSLLINLLFWKKQIREYDAAAKKPTVRYVSKIVLFFVFLSLILFLSFHLWFSCLIHLLLLTLSQCTLLLQQLGFLLCGEPVFSYFTGRRKIT